MDKDGHIERFNELPEPTKQFLEQLTPAKIASLERGMKAADRVEAFGFFARWTLYAMFGTFTAVVTIVSGLQVIKDWLKGG